MTIGETRQPARTAGEAGWHVSRYNIGAPVPGTNNVAIANLFKGLVPNTRPWNCTCFPSSRSSTSITR